MKILVGIIGLVVLGAIVYMVQSPAEPLKVPAEEDAKSVMTEEKEQTIVTNGVYAVQPEVSRVLWAGKKPLIEGYINTGSFGLTSGTIEMQDGVVSGEFIIDMNTLSVSKTPTKPGKESMLEGHLKGEGWFDVETFQEASFVITEAVPQTDVVSTFMYDVTGDLTMKGETHAVEFPAKVFIGSDNLLHAEASFEFDRTLWGITAGSGSFFDDLADNAIDDMVALSFSLVAERE